MCLKGVCGYHKTKNHGNVRLFCYQYICVYYQFTFTNTVQLGDRVIISENANL
jgi:hypothetical protein